MLRAIKILSLCREHRARVNIFVKTLEHTITLYVRPTEAIDCVKALIAARIGILPQDQRLLYGGKQLEAGCLADFGLQEGSTLHLVLRLLGGPGADPREESRAGQGFAPLSPDDELLRAQVKVKVTGQRGARMRPGAS